MPLLLLKLCLFFIFNAISVFPFHIVVGLTVLATIDTALLFVFEVLHELLQDFLRVHAHLLGEFKDLRVKLVVVDVVKVDLLVVLILDGLVLAVLAHQLLLLLLVVCEELLVHLQVILVHRLLAIVLTHVVVVVHEMIFRLPLLLQDFGLILKLLHQLLLKLLIILIVKIELGVNEMHLSVLVVSSSSGYLELLP